MVNDSYYSWCTKAHKLGRQFFFSLPLPGKRLKTFCFFFYLAKPSAPWVMSYLDKRKCSELCNCKTIHQSSFNRSPMVFSSMHFDKCILRKCKTFVIVFFQPLNEGILLDCIKVFISCEPVETQAHLMAFVVMYTEG